MYKSEYTLGLIASILNAIFAGMLLISLLATILFAGTAQELLGIICQDIDIPFLIDDILGLATGIASLVIGVIFIFSVAATVLGFVGASKLNKDDRNGAVLLLVAAGLSLFFGGIVTLVLLLIGGIIALSKNETGKPQPRP